MDPKHIMTRQGKDFVLYEGLLDEAHRQGLKRISTTIIQLPTTDNGEIAVVIAEVEVERGIFTGIGDASPKNVNRMIVPHLLRMAETRAKARAMRDAVNVGMTSSAELGDEEIDPDDESHSEPSNVREYHAAPTGNGDSSRTQAPHSGGEAKASQPAYKASPNKPASSNQTATIAKLSRLVNQELPTNIDELTSAQASEIITSLSAEWNRQKEAQHTRG